MIEFRPNRAGIASLLKLPAVAAHLRGRAERIADRAGPGHVVDSETGRRRVRAAVITARMSARRAEATNRTLTRAFLEERNR